MAILNENMPILLKTTFVPKKAWKLHMFSTFAHVVHMYTCGMLRRFYISTFGLIEYLANKLLNNFHILRVARFDSETGFLLHANTKSVSIIERPIDQPCGDRRFLQRPHMVCH